METGQREASLSVAQQDAEHRLTGCAVHCLAFRRCLWYNDFMESVIRNFTDIEPADRPAIEHVVGGQLGENQRVVIQVITLDGPRAVQETAPEATLPAWCRVYEGLSDAQIDDLERVVLTRADFTRSSR